MGFAYVTCEKKEVRRVEENKKKSEPKHLAAPPIEKTQMAGRFPKKPNNSNSPLKSLWRLGATTAATPWYLLQVGKMLILKGVNRLV